MNVAKPGAPTSIEIESKRATRILYRQRRSTTRISFSKKRTLAQLDSVQLSRESIERWAVGGKIETNEKSRTEDVARDVASGAS